jgi:hypothetical protein
MLVGVVVLAGCGGSSDDGQSALTVPAYGQFPAMTVPVTQGTAAACREKARAFGRAAEGFLRPFPSDSDIYRVLARVQFTAFQARHCDVATLRTTLSRRLTPEELRTVLAYFGFLGAVGRELAKPVSR